MAASGGNLLSLPDVVLLNVLEFLSLEDLVNLLEVDGRFENLITGASIAK